MNRVELNIRRDEGNYLLRQLTELTRRGLLNWECGEYHPIRLWADDEHDPGTWILSHSILVWSYYQGRTYCADIDETIRILDDDRYIDNGGFISLRIDYEDGNNRFELSKGKEPNVLCLFPKADMFAFADVVLPQIEGAAAVKAGFADRFSPYADGSVPGIIRRHPLTKLGKYLRGKQEVVPFHMAVMNEEYRHTLLSELEGQA